MACTFKFFLLIVLLASSMEYRAEARPFASSSTLSARLKLNDESTNCWDSLIRLQACTGEIILFFLNGETHLGHGCCEAIHIITKQCWPAMIGTLGFTTEEGDILEGYCDIANDSPLSHSPSSSPSLGHKKALAKEILVP